MKKLIFAAAIAATAAPAFAADYTMAPAATTSGNACSGHVEGYFGNTHLTGNGNSADAWAFGGAARANCNFNARWNAQGDLIVDGLTPRSSNGNGITSYGGALHIYWRDPSSYALGGFASLEGFDSSSGSFNDVYRYLIGPEGQVYFDNVTLYGQAYYGQITSGGTGFDIWGARGVVRYFANENLRFDGELGYRDMSVPGTDLTVFTAAAEANYRFANSPFSVFGRYQFDHLTPSGGNEIDLHKFVVGVRASFGSKSLLDEDRNGATMDTIQPNYIIY